MAWQDRPYHREGGSSNLRLGFTPPTPMTLYVIVACVVVFILQNMPATQNDVLYWGALSFRDGRGWQIWRLVTYQYLHADSLHIFFNLLGIYFFLSPLDRLWGPKKAFIFYTLGGIAGGLTFGMATWMFHMPAFLVGASGSVLATLGACALLFPEMTIYLIIIPISIRALAVLVALLYALSIIGEQNLSNACHLGGLAFGVAGPLWGGPLLRRFERQMQMRKLRRIANEEEFEEGEVDRILQKVHDNGMHSLNWRERRVLRKATERQRKRDMEMAKRRAY